MRIAVLADVHGNLAALTAVMAEIAHAAPDLVVNLGDLVSGPFDPTGSAEAQMRAGYRTIAGNHERQLLGDGDGALDTLARSLLSPAHLAWLATLPATLALDGGDVFACHGSPAGGDLDYLLEDVGSGRPTLAADALLRARLAGHGGARVVLCGHTHIPRLAHVDGVLVVNPGSVGLPAYRASSPTPHVMEAGSPLARFALVERRRAGWSAALHAVPYDHEVAARQAEGFGFPHIAHAVRTGRLP